MHGVRITPVQNVRRKDPWAMCRPYSGVEHLFYKGLQLRCFTALLVTVSATRIAGKIATVYPPKRGAGRDVGVANMIKVYG